MAIWYGICGILFYVGYVLAFPTTYVYIDAQEIMQAGIVKNLIYTMSDLFEFLFAVLQIFLVVTLVKLLTKKKKITKNIDCHYFFNHKYSDYFSDNIARKISSSFPRITKSRIS